MNKTLFASDRSFTPARTNFRIAFRSMRVAFSIMVLVTFQCIAFSTSAQNVTEITTDFGGFWKTSSASISPIKPNNSHNLLSYTFNGVRYSTGVSDSTLTANGTSFVPGDYRALPFYSYSGVITSNTKIGLGELYDGVSNGPSNPAPLNDIPTYLTDGKKGLDLGTCVANLPAGNLFFAVNHFDTILIGDGVPDILVTQVADPAGATDKYSFVDIFGARVGNEITVNLTGVLTLGNWTVDFYEANTNPMTLAGGFTKTDRPIRLYAADFSAFGINSANISSIAYFRIQLSGNSDVAFVSYNVNTVTLGAKLLPVKLTAFNGKYAESKTDLKWTAENEIKSDRYEVESSADGKSFSRIASIASKGIAAGAVTYNFADSKPFAGYSYYRLKMVDKDGSFTYSPIIKIATHESQMQISVYPNPATDYVVISSGTAFNGAEAQLVAQNGAVVTRKLLDKGSFTSTLDVSHVPSGLYTLVLKQNNTNESYKVIVQ